MKKKGKKKKPVKKTEPSEEERKKKKKPVKKIKPSEEERKKKKPSEDRTSEKEEEEKKSQWSKGAAKWVPHMCLITKMPLSYELWKLKTTKRCFQFP